MILISFFDNFFIIYLFFNGHCFLILQKNSILFIYYMCIILFLTYTMNENNKNIFSLLKNYISHLSKNIQIRDDNDQIYL